MAEKEVIRPFTDFPVLIEMDFADLLTQRAEIKGTMEELDKQLKDVNSQIEAAMVVAEVGKVEWEGRPVERRNGRSASSIDGKLLASEGVDPDVIKRCTKPGAPYTYIMVGMTEEEKAEAAAKKRMAKEDKELGVAGGDA